ncbi:aminomethyl-transferring glycine dehydrogenase subunit GcvPB [bacterium]|nr:aminomethyl-transferring glycine dehydrogenase subunit GcvPB [bacterium]
MTVKLLIESSKKGNTGIHLPLKSNFPKTDLHQTFPNEWVRETIGLPNVSEPEVVRHFTNLASLNYGVDSGFYPLGSCTMKYNPKINEKLANLEGFTKTHPLQPDFTVQGNLYLMMHFEQLLAEITGMDAFTLLPAAGAHGELTGMMIVKAYFQNKGEAEKRTKILIPESAHGTNPASAASVGFEIVEVKSTNCGGVDVAHLKEVMNDQVAAIMLTNPNTAGVFETDILEVAEIMHQNGSLLYYDGANLNALLGQVRPGDMGFDIVHLNLHKTFSTPHGGGGPGSAPVGVKEYLREYLPVPVIRERNHQITSETDQFNSIGMIRLAGSNFQVIVKAYLYILTMGSDGLKKASSIAVLNANYIKEKLSPFIPAGVPCICMHECVLSAKDFAPYGVQAKDISKRLIDYGFHPPTNYFPLIIPEALMIEPTETESKETMDHFIDAMKKIVQEAKENPSLLLEAPHYTPISRPDEVKAAKDLNVTY